MQHASEKQIGLRIYSILEENVNGKHHFSCDGAILCTSGTGPLMGPMFISQISVSQTSDNRGPLHRRSAHMRTTFVTFPTR
jgi:hypothetical protein